MCGFVNMMQNNNKSTNVSFQPKHWTVYSVFLLPRYLLCVCVFLFCYVCLVLGFCCNPIVCIYILIYVGIYLHRSNTLNIVHEFSSCARFHYNHKQNTRNRLVVSFSPISMHIWITYKILFYFWSQTHTLFTFRPETKQKKLTVMYIRSNIYLSFIVKWRLRYIYILLRKLCTLLCFVCVLWNDSNWISRLICMWIENENKK